jgi:hypothetical protein
MADNSCMTPQGFNENSGLRASDADRDRAASVVNNALAEGRLSAEEHSDRLDAIYAAKTHAELVPLLADLPDHPGGAAPAATAADRPRRSAKIIAVLGGASRKGIWHPEPVTCVVTVLGGAELDFREAVLPGREITLRAVSVLGGVEVTVPPEMRVIDNGFAVLGGREITGGGEAVTEESPVLRIEGVAVLGGIEVKRKSRRRKGDKSLGDGTAASLPGPLGLHEAIGMARDQHRDALRQVRDQRRDLRHQMRDRHRELRRPRGGDEGD